MSIGMNLRKALSATTLALAMAAALVVVPLGASANNGTSDDVTVCNTANGRGGDMVVDTLDPQAPVHVTSGLREKQGGKNMNAAMHSRALSVCSLPEDAGGSVPVGPTDGTGGPGGNNG